MLHVPSPTPFKLHARIFEISQQCSKYRPFEDACRLPALTGRGPVTPESRLVLQKRLRDWYWRWLWRLLAHSTAFYTWHAWQPERNKTAKTQHLSYCADTIDFWDMTIVYSTKYHFLSSSQVSRWNISEGRSWYFVLPKCQCYSPPLRPSIPRMTICHLGHQVNLHSATNPWAN